MNKILIVTGSPNKYGLTAACGEQARLGTVAAGAEAVVVRLKDLNVGMCMACKRVGVHAWKNILARPVMTFNSCMLHSKKWPLL